MKAVEIDRILDAQCSFFANGATLPVEFRIKKLKKLYSVIK